MNVINQGEADLQKTREAEEKLEVNYFTVNKRNPPPSSSHVLAHPVYQEHQNKSIQAL